MKYVALTGGLGNQMFGYAFCLNLRTKGEKVVLFVPHHSNSKSYGHQGYELEKLFYIKRYDEVLSKVFSQLLTIYSHSLRIFPVKWKRYCYKLIGIHVVKVPENFIIYPEVFFSRHKNELFMGTWQSERFFESAIEQVKNAFVFKKDLISEKSAQLTCLIKSSNSVSIHIRRGDYLSNQNSKGFAGVCIDEYYLKAIQYMSPLRKVRVDNCLIII